MSLTQPHQKLGAIRRHFSHLSSSSRPNCNFVSSSKSVSPPLTHQTPKVVDSKENQANSLSAEFDLGANLEAYKKRCNELETENVRLMDNQGKIIAESNRRIECHLKEIRCLKEQMDAQKKTNAELLKCAQTAEEESRRAKELSKEWQKFGQCNNQLMKKELHSHQLQMDHWEAKMAKLATENLELKRLCLYLDEQRQTFWSQLSAASGNTKVSSSIRSHSVKPFEFAMGNVNYLSSEDADCCRSSDDATECVNTTGQKGKMHREEENKAKKKDAIRMDYEAIQLDYEQEEVLQSICSELSIFMSNGSTESVLPHFSVCAPKIVAIGHQMMPSVGIGCDSNRPLSSSTMISNSSSAPSTTYYGGSAGLSSYSTEDPTAVVVGHELDETDGKRMSRSVVAEQSLKVHELCTINEEEDRAESNIRQKYGKMGRELEETLDGAVCSSMVAETGSMFTSLMHSVEKPPSKQQQMIEAFGRTVESSAELVPNHRNSTGSSSTSSGAFSDISRCTDEDGEDTEAMERLKSSNRDGEKEEEGDDLPPQMPLITPNECRRFVRHSFREFPFDQRSSSSMAISVSTAQQQQILQRQSSTLPRTPLFQTEEPQSQCVYNNQRTEKMMDNNTSDQKKGKQLHQMPIRIRVRPPPMQQPSL